MIVRDWLAAEPADSEPSASEPAASELAAGNTAPAAGWFLIAQHDHAILSRELAAAWAPDRPGALVAAEQLLPAIEIHDAGWARWEQQPDLDETRRPRDFWHMRIVDALEIWRRSIQAAAELGPLADYIVSGHFTALGSQALRGPQESAWGKLLLARWSADSTKAIVDHESTENKEKSSPLLRGIASDQALLEKILQARADNTLGPLSEKTVAVLGFLDEQRWRQYRAIESWQAAGGGPVLSTALAQLQLFDALSLWFCRWEQPETTTFHPPGGTPVTFRAPVTLRDAERVRGRTEIRVRPWPFREGVLELAVPARTISAADVAAARTLADGDERRFSTWLSKAGQPTTLSWQVLPEVAI